MTAFNFTRGYVASTIAGVEVGGHVQFNTVSVLVYNIVATLELAIVSVLCCTYQFEIAFAWYYGLTTALLEKLVINVQA